MTGVVMMTNKLNAVYLIPYSGSEIPRGPPLLSYYTCGREGIMIQRTLFFLFLKLYKTLHLEQTYVSE